MDALEPVLPVLIEYRQPRLRREHQLLPLPVLAHLADGQAAVGHAAHALPRLQQLPHRLGADAPRPEALEGQRPVVQLSLPGGAVQILEQGDGPAAPQLGLGQQLQLHLKLPGVGGLGLIAHVGDLHPHPAVPRLVPLGDLQHLGEGQPLHVGGEPAPRLLEEHVQLRLPLEDELGPHPLALAALRLGPQGHDLGRLPLTGGQAYPLREGEGLLLHRRQQAAALTLTPLAHGVFLRVQHPPAQGLLCGLAGRHVHGQVHPQQHLSGVQRPGLGAAQPGTGQHPALLGEARGLRLTAEGQPHLHPPQPRAPVRLVQNDRPDHAPQLHRPGLDLLAVEHGLAAHVHDAQNIRAGVRDDALQRLLLAQRQLRHRVIALQGVPFKFQFHGRCPLLIPAFRHYSDVPARLEARPGLWDTICPDRARYVTSPQTACAAAPADTWASAPPRCPCYPSLPKSSAVSG